MQQSTLQGLQSLVKAHIRNVEDAISEAKIQVNTFWLASNKEENPDSLQFNALNYWKNVLRDLRKRNKQLAQMSRELKNRDRTKTKKLRPRKPDSRIKAE